MEQQDHESPLTGDDLTKTEQGHFDEFAAIEQMAAELDGEATPNLLNPQATAEQTITGKELVMPVVALGCNLLAPAWEIQPEEVDALSSAYGELLDKYFPEGAGAFGVELSALLVTGAIIAPRLGKPRKEPTEQEKAQSQTEINTKQKAANDEETH